MRKVLDLRGLSNLNQTDIILRMIAYDLQCVAGHAFEGWFENAEQFDSQKKKGLVTCPVCGSSEVERVLSTFGIARQRHQNDEVANHLNPLEIVSRFVEKNFEDVGAEFSKEALKMHYGVADYRNIRGVSTEQEENILRDEGVEFFKVPIASQSDSEDN